MKPKIIFFGSDRYSLIVLDTLMEMKKYKIAVVTLPKNSPILDFCAKQQLPSIIWPSELEKERPMVGILASFGKIIPPEILELFLKGILNIHPSLLPRYRGPTPVPTAILQGEKITGVSIIKMDNLVDRGPIVSQFKEEIKPDDTSESLLTRLFSLGAETLSTILPAYLNDRIELRPQDHSRATYTRKLTRDGGKIDWKKDPVYLDRFIRAMYPWPGAWTEIEIRIKKRLKILKVHLESGTIQDRQPKPILDRNRYRNRFTKLVLDKVQLEGKKPVTWKQFQEGYPGAKFV